MGSGGEPSLYTTNSWPWPLKLATAKNLRRFREKNRHSGFDNGNEFVNLEKFHHHGYDTAIAMKGTEA